MDILDDIGVSKLSAKVFFFKKVNYSFNFMFLFSKIKALSQHSNVAFLVKGAVIIIRLILLLLKL